MLSYNPGRRTDQIKSANDACFLLGEHVMVTHRMDVIRNAVNIAGPRIERLEAVEQEQAMIAVEDEQVRASNWPFCLTQRKPGVLLANWPRRPIEETGAQMDRVKWRQPNVA